MWLVLIAVIGLAVALIVIGLRNRAGSGRELKDRWIEILTERYVKGEIDAEKFRAMKAELEEMGKKKG